MSSSPVLSQVTPSTGEPDAGDPHVRFGGRGDRNQSVLPTPIRAPARKRLPWTPAFAGVTVTYYRPTVSDGSKRLPTDDSANSRSGDAGEYLPLLGEQRLDPVDDRAHAGGAAQIAVDDHPIGGGEFRDRRGQPLQEGMAVADIAGDYAAAGAGADRFHMHQQR